MKAEFEYFAGNFKKHKHPTEGCDLIVCWHNDWPDCPLPVQELKPYCQGEIEIIESILHSRRLAFVAMSQEEKPLKQENVLNPSRAVDDFEDSDEEFDGLVDKLRLKYQAIIEELSLEYQTKIDELSEQSKSDSSDDLLSFSWELLEELGGTNFKGCLLVMLKATSLVLTATVCLVLLVSLVFSPVEAWNWTKWFLFDLKSFLVQLFG